MKFRWPIILLFASAILLAGAVQQGFSRLHAQTELPATFQKGFGYAAYDMGVFSSPESDAQLEEMAAMGANAVSIVGSVFQDNANSTAIFPYEDTTPPGSPPLYPSTPTDADFAHVIAKAKSLGMHVKLKIHVDLQNDPGKWRGDIGETFTPAQWTAWFDSYTDIMVRYAKLAEANNVDTFTVGTELEQTVRRLEWFDVIAAVRNEFSGDLTYAANHGNELNVAFWIVLDALGIDAYFDLTEKVNPNIVELAEAWEGPIARLEALQDANNLPIIFTEVGYLNADGNNMNPWCFACDALSDVPDPEEQALLYEALFRAVSSMPSVEGLYAWGFAEGTGGPCEIGYTPKDKPAENVIRSWYGAEERPGIESTCSTGPVPEPPSDPNAVATATPVPSTIRPIDSVTYTAPISVDIEYKGMGYSQHRAGAYSEPISDLTVDAIHATGSEWVSILVTWYQEDGISTEIASDPIKSPTDADITHVISKAHSLGLKVLLKPHVDLNNTQNGTWWRGEIGLQPDKTPVWPDGGTEWDQWFASYTAFIGHYADMAEANDVEMFSVGTELENVTRPARTDKWEAVIADVRTRYTGPLTYAANHSGEEFWIEFWKLLDIIGVDAYYGLKPVNGSAAPTVPELQGTWDPTFGASRVDDLGSLADINAGVAGDGLYMPMIFTEIGYRSLDGSTEQPWYSGFSSNQIDLEEQSAGYQALLEVFAPQPWWKGVFWWSYEIEADSSGACDDGFSPHSKPAENVVRAWYGAAQRTDIEATCSNPVPTPVPATPTPVIIPAPAGSGLGYADLSIYAIDSAKFVTQLLTMPNYVAGITVYEGIVPDPAQFEYGLEEKSARDYRGTEICGYIIPPISGDYQFATSGDDAAWLKLSTDISEANLTQISSFPFWTNSKDWTKYPEQISEPIPLLKGHPYRFEVLHINRTGGDRVEVGWKGPGFNMQLIGPDYLWPCSEAAPTPVPTSGDAPTSVPTKTPTPVDTPTPLPTNTPVPPEPTATTLPGEPTSTPAPTNTSVPLPTATATTVPPTAVPTATPVVPAGNAEAGWGSTGNAGAPGSQFMLSGQNFAPNETVTVMVTFNGQNQRYTITADANGAFNAAVTTESDLALTIFKFEIENYPAIVLSDLIVSPGASMLPPVTASQSIDLSNPPTGTMDQGIYLPWIAN